MSGTALPYKRTPPSWLKFTDTEVRTLSHRPQQQQLYLSLRSAARLSASSPGCPCPDQATNSDETAARLAGGPSRAEHHDLLLSQPAELCVVVVEVSLRQCLGWNNTAAVGSTTQAAGNAVSRNLTLHVKASLYDRMSRRQEGPSTRDRLREAPGAHVLRSPWIRAVFSPLSQRSQSATDPPAQHRSTAHQCHAAWHLGTSQHTHTHTTTTTPAA